MGRERKGRKRNRHRTEKHPEDDNVMEVERLKPQMQPQPGERQERTGIREEPGALGALELQAGSGLFPSSPPKSAPPLPDPKIKESSAMPSGPQRECFFLCFLGQVEQLSKTVWRQRVASVSCGFRTVRTTWEGRRGKAGDGIVFVVKLFHPGNAEVLVNIWGGVTDTEREECLK